MSHWYVRTIASASGEGAYIGEIKDPWACQGNVNGPSPSLVGVHTSFPGLSEGTAMTVSTAWGPKYGGLTTRCASNPWVSGYLGPQSSLQLQHLEAPVTRFCSTANLPPSFTVEGGAIRRGATVATLCRVWRLKPALAQGAVVRTNSRDTISQPKLSPVCDGPAPSFGGPARGS